jgi:hypothetical protein
MGKICRTAKAEPMKAPPMSNMLCTTNYRGYKLSVLHAPPRYVVNISKPGHDGQAVRCGVNAQTKDDAIAQAKAWVDQVAK